MNNRRTPFGSSGWETTLLYSVLLFHVIPLYTHDTSPFLNAVAARRDSEEGSSLLFNATRFNSTSGEAAPQSAVPGEAMPISQAQVLVRKPWASEDPGSGVQREHGPWAELGQGAGVVVGGMGAGLPTRSGARAHGRTQLDFKEEEDEDNAPHWQSEALQADGSVLVPSQLPLHSLGRPGDGQVINVGFYEPEGHQIDTPPPSRPHELQGGDPTSWTSDFYDYLSPEYSTTEAYPDEDVPTPVYMEDENISSERWPFGSEHSPAAPGPVDGGDGSPCLIGFVRRNGTCQSPCDSSHIYCFNGGKCYTTDAGAFCRCNLQNYTWSKGTRCESVITDFQVICFVVGGASVTTLFLFMVIVFFSKRLHLLKVENKRLRKRRSRPQSEQHNDTFSLSTVAEGSQANVRKPCDSPPNSSPAHATAYYDNMICQKTMSQYTWECKPNEELCVEDDTGKQEAPVQTPTKDDEALNIQNSLTPKHEDDKPSCEEADEGGPTIDLELLLPKEAVPSEATPPLQCNVFLSELPITPQKSPALRQPPGRSGQGRPLSQVYPSQDPEPGHSPASTRSLPPLLSRTDSPLLGTASTP